MRCVYRSHHRSLLRILCSLLLAVGCLLGPISVARAQAEIKPTPEVQMLLDQADKAELATKHEDSLRLYASALSLARDRKDQVGEAVALRRTGNVYLAAVQPQKALEFYQQSLLICRAIGDKKDEAAVLGNISLIYNQTGQPQKALEVYQQALPLYRQMGDKGKEAQTLGDIGFIHIDIGQPQKALKFFQQALALNRQTGNRQNEAITLYNIGLIYKNTGELQSALKFYQQALPISRAIGDKGEEAATLTNIGNVYADTGQPQKALEFYQQALLLHRQTGNRQYEAVTLSGIGGVYDRTGEPQKALEFYQQALSLNRQTGDKKLEAGILGNIGGVYSILGQLQKAQVVFQQALTIYRAIGDKEGEAGTLSNVGLVYADTGQQQKALKFYKQALPLHRQAGNRQFEAVTLSNIGAVYSTLGQPQKAMEFYQQALPLHRAIGDKGGEAGELCKIGFVYADSAQPRKAMTFFQQALPLQRLTGNRRYEAYTLSGMGRVYADTGEPQKSLTFYQQTLIILRAIGDKNEEANTLDYIARDEQKLRRGHDALRHSQQAVHIFEELRGNLSGNTQDRSAFLASNLPIYYHYLDLLRQAGQTPQALELAQKTKARSLLDLLASSRVDLDTVLTPEERRQVQALRQQAELLDHQLIKEGVVNAVGAKKRSAALQGQLRRTEQNLQTLLDTLYARHPGLADQQVARTASSADLARLLPADTALLEYLQVSNKQLLLFVVTKHAGKAQTNLYPIEVTKVALQQQCAAFHTACADPRKDVRPLSQKLSRLLLTPALRQLAGKKRLIICPDGPLWDVSFAALRAPSIGGTTQANASYLWERYELAYAYSATGMQAALSAHDRHKTSAINSVLALANPDFGDSSRFGDLDDLPGQRPFELASRPFEMASRPFEMGSRPIMPPSRQMVAALERNKVIKSLPGAQREAAAILKLFPDAAIYTGKQAQERIVTQEGGKYRYLHFATHGFFNNAAPLLSCIVLAQPDKASAQGSDKIEDLTNNKDENKTSVLNKDITTNKDEKSGNMDENKDETVDDGLLTARKVFGLHLHADLVTLSACNSGRGSIRTGDGVIGLTWAFFVAGCPAQVVSQWSVDDAATGQLMQDFYAGLKAGQSKSGALRSAGLRLRKDGKHGHPYYWAPFFVVGDWR